MYELNRILCPILGDIGWYSRGGGKSKIKVSAGLVPSERSEENLSQFLVVAGSVGVLGCQKHHSYLCVHLQMGFSPYVSVS